MGEDMLSRIIQIGKVHAVDTNSHQVRVKFEATGIISDWLSVLRNRPGVSASSASVGDHGSHGHTIHVAEWMPKVNDTVLVLFLPVFNSDGFVIGGI